MEHKRFEVLAKFPESACPDGKRFFRLTCVKEGTGAAQMLREVRKTGTLHELVGGGEAVDKDEFLRDYDLQFHATTAIMRALEDLARNELTTALVLQQRWLD